MQRSAGRYDDRATRRGGTDGRVAWCDIIRGALDGRRGEKVTLRSFRDGALFAESEGDDVRVVGLHGWGRDRHDLGEALRGLPALRFDLPGFGASPPPPAVWGAADYAALVAGALDDTARGPFVVVGHSFGGRVAVCLAADRPDLVGGLVLCGVPLVRATPPRGPSLRHRLVRAGHRVGVVGDAAYERWRQRHGSADYRAARGIMRDVLVRAVNETYEDQLARVVAPVAMVWGARDTEVPPDVARRAAALVHAPVEVVVVDNAGHDVHREAGAAVRAQVERLLGSASP
jgi:pimeloyl-ACP methyl ester carboxylesterase